MKIKIHSKSFEAEKVSGFGRFFGLMFVRREKAKALVFEFEKPARLRIHSCFVFFPFIAIWLDDKNRIIEKRIVMPFRLSISCKESFSKLIEIPLNKTYKKESISLLGG